MPVGFSAAAPPRFNAANDEEASRGAYGMYVHKQETQVCIEDGAAIVVLEQRIRTTHVRFTAPFGGRPQACILSKPRRSSKPRRRVSGWRSTSRRSGPK